MYRNNQHREGINKVASIYDALSVPNRTKEVLVNNDMENALLKVASSIDIDETLHKQANFSNGLEMFTGVRKMISNSLGVSEDVAQNMTSGVITKSNKIAQEYGGDAMQVASGVIEEMAGQVADNPNILSNDKMHPMRTHNGNLQDQIKMRLMQECSLNQRDADIYKTLVLKQSQDLVTMLRPHSKDDIAMAMIDVVSSTGDITTLYGFKDSPVMVSTLRTELGG